MTLKDLFIAICITGSTIIVIYGGWNYMMGRINHFNETQKGVLEQAKGNYEYNNKPLLSKIKKEESQALIMFVSGATVILFIITHLYQRKKIST
ncbi:MAG: hypothetical protein JST23_04315 [Bacteroidetes bacterium]|nr:hypothetical protein [Bacteroidota bacterium]